MLVMDNLNTHNEALFGKRSAHARAWYDKYRVKLLEQANGPAAVQRSMVYYRQRQRLSKTRQKALAAEQTFFRRNQRRMDYAGFRARGLPIGIGASRTRRESGRTEQRGRVAFSSRRTASTLAEQGR